jgi:UTP-glucose-1-phosphate uridylyltransferase
MGTRFLPATKSIPKEMLPLDRPLIQYAIDEAREACIEEFIFVTAAGKGASEDYVDTAAALEKDLPLATKPKRWLRSKARVSQKVPLLSCAKTIHWAWGMLFVWRLA